MKRHIIRLKRHRNALYGIVFTLLVFQILSFISVTTQLTKISAEQNSMERGLEKSIDNLDIKIEDTKHETQYNIIALASELNTQITEQKKDFKSEINLLKASQEDFSGIIEMVTSGTVSVITDRSAGSGFLIEDGSYIVTNFHVLQNALTIQIHLFNGNSLDAKIIGYDQTSDIALLQIPGNFQSLPLANSEEVQIGEKVIAIGNPLGLSFTVTEGIVSAAKRMGPNGQNNYFQTDVTLNPGNSGGPLINKKGEVIGINNFKIGGAEGLGFALESNKIKEVVNNLLIQNTQQNAQT